MFLILRFRKFVSRRLCSSSLTVIALVSINSCAVLRAQQAASDNALPDAPAASASAFSATLSASPSPSPAPQSPGADPSAQQSQPAPQNRPARGTTEDEGGQQTKRILGIIPNFRAVSANVELPPETIKEKFMDATQDSFDYSSIFFPAVIAAYNMDERTTPEFREGAAGYARYFWHSAVDQTSENYMVEFIFPTFTREDSRYYTLGHGGFFKRTGYALSRAVITRTNSGAETFNVSEVFGAGAAAGVSNLYYPSASRTVGNTTAEWAEDIGIDAGTFWFREFWPDINRHVFRNRYSDAPAQK